MMSPTSTSLNRPGGRPCQRRQWFPRRIPCQHPPYTWMNILVPEPNVIRQCIIQPHLAGRAVPEGDLMELNGSSSRRCCAATAPASAVPGPAAPTTTSWPTGLTTPAPARPGRTSSVRPTAVQSGSAPTRPAHGDHFVESRPPWLPGSTPNRPLGPRSVNLLTHMPNRVRL